MQRQILARRGRVLHRHAFDQRVDVAIESVARMVTTDMGCANPTARPDVQPCSALNEAIKPLREGNGADAEGLSPEYATHVAAPGAGDPGRPGRGREQVEPRRDPIRLFFASVGVEEERNSVFDLDNRGKRAIVLDTQSPTG